MYEVDIKIEYRKFALSKFIKNNGIEIFYGECILYVRCEK